MIERSEIERLQGLDMSKLRKASICILGGTGFIGTWLISTLNSISKTHDLRISLTVYTRNKVDALIKFPKEEYDSLIIREFDFLKGTCNLGTFDFIINGATPTSTKPGFNTENVFFHPTMNAVQSIIGTAKLIQNSPKVLNLSSGAVYGRQPLGVSNQPECRAEILNGADDYQRAKYSSEVALSSPEALEVLLPISPRLFAFYGPGLPLDKHFAIGNFIQDGLAGRKIRVLGNPATRRSYMYPSDLIAWLLKSLVQPKLGDFNVGSESSISMGELAYLVSGLTSNKGVELLNPKVPPNNYVPSTLNFRSSYEVEETVTLLDGLHAWISALS
jgi:nucleoside-diphosphate-sugar epimerase